MLDHLNYACLIAKLKHDQWKGHDEISDIQREKLAGLCSYASRHVPFYREAKANELEDLQGLPVIRKEQLRDHPEKFLSRRYDRKSLKVLSTSGSTGAPLRFYISKDDEMMRGAIMRYGYHEAGLLPFQKVAFITYDVHKKPPSFFVRYHLLPMFGDMKGNLKMLKSIRPSILRSYPSVLALLAKANMEEDQAFTVPKVFSGAEVLPCKIRQMVSKSFDSEVRDFYGTIEAGRVAWECEEGSLHIISDQMIPEVVDDMGLPAKSGEPGHLLITTLFQRAMPLIRYDTGDIASLGSGCRCGRGQQVIKEIKGREPTFLVMKSGRICHSLAFDIYMRTFPGILLFKAVQDSPGKLILYVIPKGRLKKRDRAAMMQGIQSCFPEPLDISMEMADEIPRGPGGKIQAVVSNIGVEL